MLYSGEEEHEIAAVEPVRAWGRKGPEMFPAWDGELLILIQKVTEHPALDAFFTSFTQLGNHGELWIALGVVLLLFKKTRGTGLLLLISLLVAHLFNTLFLKELIDRPRPYEVMPDVRLLIGAVSESSFPSGHAATAFASAIVVFRRETGFLRWSVLVAAILMAFSRLYIGVHYPLDVLAGALIGTLIALLVTWLGPKAADAISRRTSRRA